MSQRVNRKIVGWLFAAAFLAGCAFPSFAAPPAPEPQPFESLGTAIAQTAAAAQTQTAAARPTLTSTPTPTFTPSVTPTFTPTFIFIIVTDTATPTVTSTARSVSTSGAKQGGDQDGDGEDDGKKNRPTFTGKPWSCLGVGKFPPNYTQFKPGARFTAQWTLMNTGTKHWTINTIDIVYTGGYRHENTKIQDFPRNARAGDTITVTADFIAPKAPGEYSSYFTLMVGNKQFCGMAIHFIVVEK